MHIYNVSCGLSAGYLVQYYIHATPSQICQALLRNQEKSYTGMVALSFLVKLDGNLRDNEDDSS